MLPIATFDQTGVHYHGDAQIVWTTEIALKPDTEFTYTFESFFHPFVGDLVQKLNTESLAGMLDPEFHQQLEAGFTAADYTWHPEEKRIAFSKPPPRKAIDVREGGPYSGYNWELLFHVPLSIAVHLSKNQRFAEAQRWFHYIFDPTSTDASQPSPQRYWKFLRFRKETDVQQIDDLLLLLSKPDGDCTQDERDFKTRIKDGYTAIREHPFQPHRVARTRTVAYQYSVVMKYLDNLIAWGDSLFAQDTVESINEATQRYVLAANLLGPRPQRIPTPGGARPHTFNELKARQLDLTGNALVQLESKFPFNLGVPSIEGRSDEQDGPLFGIGRTLYFCIPRNDKLLGYWDTVGDRLQKIRNCMNIQGVVRQLALFDPPLDPGMLVKAAAAGIDVGSIVSGLGQPAGPVRAQAMLQKALELSGEVRGLGNALLAAIEKREGERMALLRQGHEIRTQRLAQEARFLQWKQAEESTASLLRARASAVERYDNALRLLGMTRDTGRVPDTFALGQRRELTEENFDDVFGELVGQFDRPVQTQRMPRLSPAGSASPASQSGAVGRGALYLNANEDAELNRHLPAARDTRLVASAIDATASVLALLPEVDIDLHYWGLGAHSNIFGGSKLMAATRIGADILRTTSAWEQDQAGMASRTASYERRADEWIAQANLAARELMQMGRQIIGSLIAEQIARREYLNTVAQIEQSQEVDRFLRDKFSNEELYAWMQGELSRLYYEYYRLAFDTARKAERAMKRELMRPEVEATTFVKFNYWDAGRKGLLSGDELYLDLKRMELAWIENNRREFEITRHVSLRQLDPAALMALRVTGTCDFTIPEWFYDRDFPGHYMRRIKSVAVSVPSVVGPYTSLSGTLSLVRSTIRTSSQTASADGSAYVRDGMNDGRFLDSFGGIEQIVTSGGVNDSGMFETNLRDERPLPFEGAGAESTWRLDLPRHYRAFDYLSISDVVLHVRYTARQGGEILATGATAALKTILESESGPLALLFSLQHDFSTAWHAFLSNTTQNLQITLRKDHFPYMVLDSGLGLVSIHVAAESDGEVVSKPINTDLPALSGALNGNAGEAQLHIPANIEGLDLTQPDIRPFMIVRYQLAVPA